jgi:hypothetical protein
LLEGKVTNARMVFERLVVGLPQIRKLLLDGGGWPRMQGFVPNC